MRKDADILFKCLGDPTRRSIFEHLCREGRVTVSNLTGRARISQPAVSKHLRLLKQAGLVRSTRSGRETHYSVAANGVAPLVDWLKYYSAFWADRLGRLEAILNQLP